MVCGFVGQFLAFWGGWKEKVLYFFLISSRGARTWELVSRFVLSDLYHELTHSIKVCWLNKGARCQTLRRKKKPHQGAYNFVKEMTSPQILGTRFYFYYYYFLIINVFFIGVQFANRQNNTQCSSRQVPPSVPITHSPHPPSSSPSTTPSSFPS